MTVGRILWSSLAVAVGVLVFALFKHHGAPLANVAWAAPALGVMIGALVVCGGVYHEGGRDALRIGGGVAATVASIAGFHALWRVGVYLWETTHDAGLQQVPFGRFGRLYAQGVSAWHMHWLSILFWTATALLPLFAALGLIVPVVTRAIAPAREVDDGPWRASWMTPAQADYLARQSIGFPLGRLGRKLLRFKANAAKGWRGGHHMLIAGTRGGKGVSGVLPAIIDHEGPVVAIDIKGELFAVTRRWRNSLGRRVVVLNPLSVIEPSADRFNPLDYVRTDPDHITRDAELIADGLVKPEGGDSDHFAVMARNLLAAAVEVVATIAEPADRNLNTVADLLGANVETTLEAWRDSPQAVGKSASRTAAAILGTGDKERGSILTTVSKALAWTSSAPMQRFLETSDFDLADLLADKADLFIVVPLDQVQALSAFLRLMVNIVSGAVIREWGSHNLAKPLLLVLDEFVRLGRMQKLVDIATVAPGAGIEALFVTQDRAQIASVYRDGEADTLLGACATVRVFGLGRNDTATAQWVVSGIGDRTVRTISRQLDDGKKGSGSEQRDKLFTPDQLLELPASDLIAFFSGQPPLRLTRIISHNDPAYRSKLDPNPTLRS